MRFFRRLGVDGISSDQHVAGKWYPLNMVAFARLAWNPDLELDAILADFCRGYYGKASEPMIAYWNLMEEGLRESWRSDAPIDWRDQQRAALVKDALSKAEDASTQKRIRARLPRCINCPSASDGGGATLNRRAATVEHVGRRWKQAPKAVRARRAHVHPRGSTARVSKRVGRECGHGTPAGPPSEVPTAVPLVPLRESSECPSSEDTNETRAWANGSKPNLP